MNADKPRISHIMSLPSIFLSHVSKAFPPKFIFRKSRLKDTPTVSQFSAVKLRLEHVAWIYKRGPNEEQGIGKRESQKFVSSHTQKC
jgi:hypothetical protein